MRYMVKSAAVKAALKAKGKSMTRLCSEVQIDSSKFGRSLRKEEFEVKRETALKVIKGFGAGALRVMHEPIYYSNPEYLQEWFSQSGEEVNEAAAKAGIAKGMMYVYKLRSKKIFKETALKLVKYFGRESVIIRAE